MIKRRTTQPASAQASKNQTQILDEVHSFTPSAEFRSWSEREKVSFDVREQLDRARIRELNFKHIFRIAFSLFFAALLLIQNGVVFFIVWRAFELNKLYDLQWIFATLVAATLTETYFVTKIIVNFIFSVSDYTYKPESSSLV